LGTIGYPKAVGRLSIPAEIFGSRASDLPLASSLRVLESGLSCVQLLVYGYTKLSVDKGHGPVLDCSR
jgi:hypothetical protein